MGHVAGIDLGATNLRAVVADGRGEPVGRAGRGTPQGPHGAAVTAALVEVLRDASADAGVDPADLDAVGIAGPGRVDRTTGTVEAPANLPGDRIRLRDPLADLVDGAPVPVRNDAVAGLLGERDAAGSPPDDMVYLTLSTGIGAGGCVDGHVLDGRGGGAGEVGHLVGDPAGDRTCGCGRAGHWEAYAGGEHLPEYARDLEAAEGVETALPLAEPDLDAAAILSAAGADPLADRVVDAVADWNAVGVAALVQAYAPGEVTIGGAVALGNPSLVVDPIRERLPSLAVNAVPELRTARLGGDAVVHGAVVAARAALPDR